MTFQQQYGPWAVIAGGSEGIGAAFANSLAARGLNLMLFARRLQPLQQLAASVRASHPGIQVNVQTVDLATSEAAEQVQRACADLQVGLFLYNAGAETNYGYFLDHDWEWLQGRLNRNFVTKCALLHHFGRLMRARKRGGMILMGSFAGFMGAPAYALYSSSKAFTHYLSEALWYELKQDHVHLVCTVVGMSETPAMVEAYGPMEGPTTAPEAIAEGTLQRLEKGPIWISEEIAGQVQTLAAQPPAQRATVAAQLSEQLKEKAKDYPGALPGAATGR